MPSLERCHRPSLEADPGCILSLSPAATSFRVRPCRRLQTADGLGDQEQQSSPLRLLHDVGYPLLSFRPPRWKQMGF